MSQFLVDRVDVSFDGATGRAKLAGDEARHAVKSMRLAPGDEVKLFDGAGNRYSGRIEAVGNDVVEVADLCALAPNEESVEVTLIQAMPKGARWEWLLEKGTELGVARFVPVVSERTVARPSKGSKGRKWRKKVEAAAKQCERGVVPEVADPAELEKYLYSLENDFKLRLYCAERSEEQLKAELGHAESVLLAVGPEGGWTAGERTLLEAHGFKPMSLGARVLRAETAAIVALTLVIDRLGR